MYFANLICKNIDEIFVYFSQKSKIIPGLFDGERSDNAEALAANALLAQCVGTNSAIFAAVFRATVRGFRHFCHTSI